jgi:hypothetical protein
MTVRLDPWQPLHHSKLALRGSANITGFGLKTDKARGRPSATAFAWLAADPHVFIVTPNTRLVRVYTLTVHTYIRVHTLIVYTHIPV